MQASHVPPLGPLLTDPHEVLVFRALQLGDLLCTVPALQVLRAALPSAHIVLIGLPWATQFAQRFAALVDEFLVFPGHPQLPERAADMQGWPLFRQRLRARHADLAIQLHGSGEVSNRLVRAFGARHTVGYSCDTAADGAGFYPYPWHGHESERWLSLMTALGMPVNRVQRLPFFPLTAADQDELQATSVPAQLQGKPYVCLHPGARDPQRRWPLEAFAAVADHLADTADVRIVLTGSADEQSLVQQLARTMRHRAIAAALPWSIGAMATLMAGARALVCNDSGVSHLAAALRLPSVVVFRRDELARWAPLDRTLHHCVLDPHDRKIPQVIAAVRCLIRTTARRCGSRATD